MQLIWGPVFLAVRESIWTKITQDDGLKKRTPYSLYGVGPQVKILYFYYEKKRFIPVACAFSMWVVCVCHFRTLYDHTI